MRKGLVIVALLLVLSVGFLTMAARQMDARHTAVSVTEQTLCGDPAAASGLCVSTRAISENHLFWDTTYMAGADPKPETVFTYSNQRIYEGDSSEGYFALERGSLNSGWSGIFTMEDLKVMENESGSEEAYDNVCLIKPVIDVADRTKNGESHTETVRLTDYYAVYPLYYQFHSKSTYSYYYGENAMQIWQYLNRKFPIPIPEDLKLQVTVEKNEEGQICRFEYNQPEGIEAGSWYSSSVVLEDGVFFGLFGEGDFSQIEDGYGLYYMEVTSERHNGGDIDYTWLHEETCENVCPLDRPCTEGQLLASHDEKQVYALTLEGDRLMLTVLDSQSREILQRQDTGLEALPYIIWQGDGVLALVTGDEEWENFTLHVFLVQDDGTLELWLQAPLYHEETSPYWYSTAKLCFDGQRLAIVQYYDTYDRSSHQILIYGENGLQYAGEYHHSGDDLPTRLNTWSSGLEIEWVIDKWQ